MRLSHNAKLRQLYPFKPPSSSVDHLVIGGGVVGLSVAAGLVNVCGKDRTTFLVERRGLEFGSDTLRYLVSSSCPGSGFTEETISYPVGSLKSKFCIRGRDLLYDRCIALGIPFRKTQKLIVATSNSQIPYIDHLQTHSLHSSFLTNAKASPYESNSVIPAYFLSGSEAREMEPDLSRSVTAALLLTETGIVDSQVLVDSLAREIVEPEYLSSPNEALAVGIRKGRREERGEGMLVRGTRVVRIDRNETGAGWIVQLETGWEGKEKGEQGDVDSVLAEVVVNAAGLAASSLLEGVVPDTERISMWPAKGNYMSYKGPGVSHISRLIYPCPSDGLDHLGTHLTLDLDGNVRFGPDVENIGDPSTSFANPDFWQEHLTPSSERIASIGKAVQDYLPGIDPTLLSPDYSGIRPNIAPPNSGFSDFLIRHSRGRKGLVEMLGFNSPGLTSGLAVGEYVAAMIRKDVWKAGADVAALAEDWD